MFYIMVLAERHVQPCVGLKQWGDSVQKSINIIKRRVEISCGIWIRLYACHASLHKSNISLCNPSLGLNKIQQRELYKEMIYRNHLVTLMLVLQFIFAHKALISRMTMYKYIFIEILYSCVYFYITHWYAWLCHQELVACSALSERM